MILPTKHIPAEQSFLGIGAELLQFLQQPRTVSGLWDEVKDIACIGNFERFILGMDMLFILGLVKFEDGKVTKIQS